jgi:hypothetical protein
MNLENILVDRNMFFVNEVWRFGKFTRGIPANPGCHPLFC